MSKNPGLRAILVASLAAATLLAGCKSPTTAGAPVIVADVAIVDASGALRVPADYRTSYSYLGTWSVAADTGSGAKQLHIVYASPGAVAAFRTTGGFPDGTVLVKEVFDAETGAMTTGTVSHAKTIAGWFVMVKDSKNSHPGNALWGDGWGWSWFDAANPKKTTSTDYKADCQACHEPAKATDWIYRQGYPVLQKG
jgi:Cytochrome P460